MGVVIVLIGVVTIINLLVSKHGPRGHIMSSSIPLPPFPSPKGDLEEFLLSPHNLPIHDFSRQQKSVRFYIG